LPWRDRLLHQKPNCIGARFAQFALRVLAIDANEVKTQRFNFRSDRRLTIPAILRRRDFNIAVKHRAIWELAAFRQAALQPSTSQIV
jgi:hypothetical protein